MRPVQALIVTYNHAGEIADCVKAAWLQRDADVQVVVVDNASDDGTREVVAGLGPRVTVVQREHNDGYAGASNVGFDALGDGDVLLLNPDVQMDPGCVAALQAHLAARPACGAVAALLRNADGTAQRFAVRDPDLRAVAMTSTHIGRRLDRRRGHPARAHRYYEDLWSAGVSSPVAVDCPAAACVLIRRGALDKPLMDPLLPLFFNDGDLWQRLRERGWTVEVSPAAGAVHEGGTSIRRTDPVRIRGEWVVSMRRYVGRGRGPLGRGALYGIFLADVVGSLVLVATGRADEETRVWLRGTLGGLGLPGGPPPWLTPVRRLIRPRRRHRS